MIEERALVVSLEGPSQNFAKVRTQRQSACQSCQLKSGCGQSSFAKLSGDKSIELSVANTLGVKPGDIVMLAIPEQGLIIASLMMYLLPLVLMVVIAGAAKGALGWQDGAVALSGIAGLVAGFFIARRYSRQHDQDERFSPKMTAIALQANPAAVCASSLTP